LAGAFERRHDVVVDLGGALEVANIRLEEFPVELKLRIAPTMIRLGSTGKNLFGAVLVVLGLLIVTDVDRLIEANLTDALPYWLVELTTRY
jgi:hypothetical protein